MFDGLSQQQRQQLCEMLPPPQAFEKGEVIYGTSTKRSVGVLLEGKAECIAHSGGVLMKVFYPGEVFGAACVFGADAASVITALTPCRVQDIPQDTLLAWFAQYPCVAINYVRFLSSKVQFLNRKIALLTMDSAQARLMEYLLAHADAHGCVQAGNMSRLAKTLGIGRTSLYRALDGLLQDGWITRREHQIFIKEQQQ